ncbi:hypothetical protein ASPZODRAFT_157525 [Penicilliopsis zonata CBS 506.65]|uniref:Uncharacterized protein n=1 Tax=Penicilliopsis zonata CBS 506.65 TaxID=1073090 RepID=A0A1L9SPJ5_9EURO|nr:hypothetical protein ASPZODRAFT_157525 [Penicilliopsis zonata CBS 506.65]OJJ49046.1 hypothetical protein ASPZODRAFT_157525 [Penicilliopsis zonata CBS 506.65]
MSSLAQKLAQLQSYSACDVSDALLKLQTLQPARAGYLADLTPHSPLGRSTTLPKIIAPATTFKFIPRHEEPPVLATSSPDTHGFPAGTHWVDFAQPETVVVLEQPEGQTCAVLGGIMAARMKYLGVRAVVVDGRVRDLAELHATEIPVWAFGTSTVGTSAEAKPGVRNVSVSIRGVTVSPGDIIFCDPLEGVVAIPQDLLDPVLELMPKLVAMDDRVKEAVVNGMSVYEAFQKFRK